MPGVRIGRWGHIVPGVRISRLSHVMAGVGIGRWGHVVPSVRIGRRSHVMTGVRVGRRGHVVTGVRIRRRLGAHVVTRMGILRRRRGRCVMVIMILGGGHARDGHKRCKADQQTAHAASPSRGRTVTTLNMPACMCISMWQWNAQSPGASAVRSKVTVEPGATLTVCFSG